MNSAYRDNGKGMRFIINGDDNETLILWGVKSIKIKFSFNEVNQAWYNWQMKGQLIQQAFHFLSPAEREFLLTGMTKAEWNELFKEENEV